MNKEYTGRGFGIYRFVDSGGNECSLQQSSAIGDYVWLGSKEIGVQGFQPGNGWESITDDDIKTKFDVTDIIANNRMHLNRAQVAALIPILQNFVDTGEV
ncbi:MAG: hypothetical protein EKK57_04945 [Proteobacteria bacterium]|nr:MAG: hypothetical protein EKK57_04945 [Pseudomonadota bacterium]